MSTNFYVASERCPHCGRHDEDLHIGKRSAGWQFHFQGYFDEKNITSWLDWKEYLKGKKIIDEYNDPIDYDVFVRMVETTRVNGLSNHFDYCHRMGYDMSGYWKDSDGWSFSKRDFS